MSTETTLIIRASGFGGNISCVSVTPGASSLVNVADKHIVGIAQRTPITPTTSANRSLLWNNEIMIHLVVYTIIQETFCIAGLYDFVV
jgi:hypothetical protein